MSGFPGLWKNASTAIRSFCVTIRFCFVLHNLCFRWHHPCNGCSRHAVFQNCVEIVVITSEYFEVLNYISSSHTSADPSQVIIVGSSAAMYYQTILCMQYHLRGVTYVSARHKTMHCNVIYKAKPWEKPIWRDPQWGLKGQGTLCPSPSA